MARFQISSPVIKDSEIQTEVRKLGTELLAKINILAQNLKAYMDASLVSFTTQTLTATIAVIKTLTVTTINGMIVGGGTLSSGLNADLLDGQHGQWYLDNANGNMPPLDSLALAIPATDVPAYPDGVADQLVTSFTTYPAGWTANGTSAVSFAGNLWQIHPDATNYGFYYPSISASKMIVVRFRVLTGVALIGFSATATTYTNADWQTVSLKSDGSSNYLLYGTTSTAIFQISAIYIGDGTYATKVIEASKSNLRLTNVGAIPVPSVGGMGLMFNGASALTVSSSVGAISSGQCSFSCLFYQTVSTGAQTILSNRNSSGWSWILWTNSGILQFYGNAAYSSGVSPSLNTWHHVAVFVDGAGKVTIYLDGVVVLALTAFTYGASPQSVINEGGWYNGATLTEPLLGTITNPLIWTGYALTDANVKWLYANKNQLPGVDGIVAIRANTPVVGTPVASVAGVITPTGNSFHVTGALAITGIAFIGIQQITIIPDGAFTWTAATNIALAGTAVVSKAVIFTYDLNVSKWYPSYV